jgi:NADH-quinone oxidoreductase subunit N
MTFDLSQLSGVVAFLIISGMACALLVVETLVRGRSREGLMWLGVASCLAALVALVYQWGDAATPQTIFQDMWVVDRMGIFLDGVFVITAAVTLMLSSSYLREHDFELGEFYALVLFATAGMIMVVHASHLLMLLVAIETMSLAAYVLTGCWRRNPRSSEGALKYFLMGAFATGFLVYGSALVYGTTGGAMSYSAILSKASESARDPLFLIGFYFILIAMVFKVAAVPFHMWAPDAYEGAPTPATGLMAAGIKAAAIGSLLRLLSGAFNVPVLATEGAAGWVNVLSVVAFLSMTLGNLAALRQENIKRMLAYSSIAHAGYVLLGLPAIGLNLEGAEPATLFYLAVYTFTTLGTFGVVAWVGRRGDERLFVEDWAGLGNARPGLALAMTLFLLSLGGVPPTGGFFAKFYLFRTAMEDPRLYWLVIAGVLNSVISLYYYLKVVVAMYFRDPLRAHQPFPSASMRFALVIAAAAVVALGVFPNAVVGWAGAVANAAGKVAGL